MTINSSNNHVSVKEKIALLWSKLQIGAYKLTNKATNPQKILGYLIFIICMLVGFELELVNLIPTMFITFFPVIVWLTLRFILGLYVRKALKNTGGRFLLTDLNYLQIDKKNKLLRIASDKLKKPNFCFAKNSDVEKIDSLSKEAYIDTIWANFRKDNCERDKTHITKNKRSILLFYNSTDESQSANIIGLTHVVPVNLYNWHKYTSGLISDTDLGEYAITSDQITGQDDRAFGLIILSAILPRSKQMNSFGDEVAGTLLTESLVFHIDSYFKNEFKTQKIVPIAFQTVDTKLMKKLKSLKINKARFLKDGGQLISLELLNTYALYKVSYPRQFIKKDESNNIFKITAKDDGLFTFANEVLSDTTAQLNIDCYEGTPWGAKSIEDQPRLLKEKKDRNSQHIKRNEKCILLLKNKKDGRYIGFTHIFPVCEKVWNNYCDGNMKDADIQAEDIIPYSKDENAFGLIIFSLAILPELKKEFSEQKIKEIAQSVENAIAFHISEQCKAVFSKKQIPVLFQSWEEELTALFEISETNEGQHSKDGVIISQVTVEIVGP